LDLLKYKKEEFEDTKEVIRIHISKMSTKGQTMIYKTYI
jgi:hypothetical protein